MATIPGVYCNFLLIGHAHKNENKWLYNLITSLNEKIIICDLMYTPGKFHLDLKFNYYFYPTTYISPISVDSLFYIGPYIKLFVMSNIVFEIPIKAIYWVICFFKHHVWYIKYGYDWLFKYSHVGLCSMFSMSNSVLGFSNYVCIFK